MLNSNPIKLTENQKIAVKVKSSKGDFFNTDITLEYGKPPSIQLILEGEKELIVHPYRDDSKGDYYISDFFDRSFINHAVFRYLFFGKANKDRIKKVYFTVPELAPYFRHELNFKLDDNVNISGKLKIEPLEARIDSLGLSIKIHQGYNLKSNDDHTGFSFQNIMYFSFESDKALSFKDIETLMYKLIALLTWVMGHPISPESIEVSDGEEYGYLYMPLAKKMKKYDKIHSESFMDLKFFRKYFQTICSNYFEKKEIFEDIWSRTTPLFDFTGVIEYEVMLYTSILDRYFDHQVSKLPKAPSQNYDKYISKLNQFFRENNDFREMFAGTDLADTLEAKKLFGKRRLSFKGKQEYYFKHIGEENLKIFINDDDFKKIKYIRDKAAHGEKGLPDVEDVYKYLWKVKLLTMYFIYRDLGVKEHDFFKIVSLTYHPIALNCEIDRYLLDIATGKTILIQLEESEIEKFKNLNAKINVFNKEKDRYFFNSDLSEMASNYFSEDLITKIDPSRIYNHEKYVQFLLNERGINLATQHYRVVHLQEKGSKTKIGNVVILSQPIDQL